MQTKDELFKKALDENDINALKTLLPDITNINIRGYHGETALISVIWNGVDVNQELIQSLLERNIDVNARTSSTKETALMCASGNNQLKVVNILLDAGAQTEIKDFEGRTAIWYAASQNHCDVMKVLLAHGANPNPTDDARINLLEGLEQSNDQGSYTNALFILKNFGTFQYRLKEVEFDENNLDADDIEIYISCRDPITLEIINDPVAVSSGITYDRKSLRDWFEHKKDLITQEIPATIPCPITKLPIQRSELNNNTHVITRGMINRFVLKQETEFRRHLQADGIPHPARASDVGIFAQSKHAALGVGVSSLASDKADSSSSSSSISNK